MTRIEKILSSGVIKAITHPDFSYDITHFRFFTFRGVDDKGEFLLIGYIAEDTSEKNAIVNGKKCSVFDLDLFVDNKVVEHFCKITLSLFLKAAAQQRPTEQSFFSLFAAAQQRPT